MIISAINGVNLNPYKKSKINTNKNIKPDVQNSKTILSTGNYGKAQVRKHPSFGFDPFILGYLAFYAATVGAAVYQSNLDDKKRAEEQRKLREQERRDVESIAKKFNVSIDDAENYHGNFLRHAAIPLRNNGNEVGLNAVQGYGIEKYRLAMDLIAPVVAKSRDSYLGYKAEIPNGVLLYGPTGGGKTYIADKVCEHLQYCGVKIKNVELDGNNHAKNVRNIKEAFSQAEENYKETGKFTIINFPQDLDNYFMDRRKYPDCVKEVRTLLNCSEKCASKGVVWMGTANNPQMIDAALLRPGRADLKLPIGDMEDFAIGDMIKYTLYKYDERESSEDFDYKKTVDSINSSNIVYTPAELELFVSRAKSHKISPEQKISADMVIAEMEQYRQNDFPTLTEEMQKLFQEDKDYISSIDKPNEEK